MLCSVNVKGGELCRFVEYDRYINLIQCFYISDLYVYFFKGGELCRSEFTSRGGYDTFDSSPLRWVSFGGRPTLPNPPFELWLSSL